MGKEGKGERRGHTMIDCANPAAWSFVYAVTEYKYEYKLTQFVGSRVASLNTSSVTSHSNR